MRYLVILDGTPPEGAPPPELMEAIMALGAEATSSGAMLDNAGLAPSAFGARVDLSGGKLTVSDGPFAESKELISYALYEVRTKEEAVEWARRFLAVHQEHWPAWEGSARVVKLFDPADFAPPA